MAYKWNPPKLVLPKRCVYCGLTLTYNDQRRQPPTCRCHRDLPALDPHYQA